VREYVDQMMAAFGDHDLIISRAGATTSAELMAAGKAAIMIPLPGQLEQRRNAEALESAGGARMILQDDLNGSRLAQEIITLVDAPEKISEMEAAARRLAKPDAAATAVDLIEKTVSSKR